MISTTPPFYAVGSDPLSNRTVEGGSEPLLGDFQGVTVTETAAGPLKAVPSPARYVKESEPS
jgi:hypothetical protein